MIISYCSISYYSIPHPSPLSRPWYDVFSGAAHVKRAYVRGPQNICHTGGLCSWGGGGNSVCTYICICIGIYVKV